MTTQYQTKMVKALQIAFVYTVPILAGFSFLGLVYGIYIHASGLPFWYPMIASLTIYAGSMEFVTIGLLLGNFAPLQALCLALLINTRHFFYGLSMLDHYRGQGWKTPYLIFGMCDESFSINYTSQIPPEIDRGWFMFFVTTLMYLYWFCASSLGGMFGSFLHLDIIGLEFILPSMFIVIFIEYWKKESNPISPLLGLGTSIGALIIFGPRNFILPAIVAILGILTYRYYVLNKRKHEGINL